MKKILAATIVSLLTLGIPMSLFARNNLSPFDPTRTDYPCVQEKDHLPPIDPKASVYFKEAFDMERAPGTKNYKRIAELYGKAAELNHWKAIVNLAGLYYKGLGVPDDEQMLVKLMQQLIDLNVPLGYYNMGTFYADGVGVKRDRDTALAYYQKAAELGSPAAQAALAKELGKIKYNRRALANKLLECAAEQGHADAALDLGISYHKKDNAKALKYYQLAAGLGSALAAHALNAAFEIGPDAGFQSLDVAVDKERARRYKLIRNALKSDPFLRLDMDALVPLPPAPLPQWRGVPKTYAPGFGK